MYEKKNKRQATLFLRIFISFWLAMALILLIGMAFTSWVYINRHHSLDNVTVVPLIAEARRVAQVSGDEGLRQWRKKSEADYDALDVFVIDQNFQDIDKRTLSTRLIEMLKVYSKLSYQNPEDDIDGRWGWWDMPRINVANGQTYTLIFLPFDSSRLEVIGRSYVPYLLLIVSLCISTLMCWILARYISTPIRHLQERARMLVDGPADSHVGEQFTGRSDELGVLARDFDHMSKRIHKLLSAKENLLRNVSHELRSPLARIDLALELARRMDDKTGLQLNRIGQESMRLNCLIGEIIELSQTHDHSSFSKKSVDLTRLLERVVIDANFEAQQYDANVLLYPAATAYVLGDENSLQKVFDNILRNAVSFTAPQSTVCVSIRHKMMADLIRDHWVVEIIDNGPGVAPKDLPHLFEPFYKAHPLARRNSSGLGLSIAANIVLAHEGMIQVKNRSKYSAADEKNESGLIVSVSLPVLASAK